jgi:hypothetical protein
MRRFPLPWAAEQIPGGYIVKDATGQSLAYVYAEATAKGPDLASTLNQYFENLSTSLFDE